MADATQLLEKINAGDRQATEDFFPLVYQELRQLAKSQLQNEVKHHTLQPTALVNEAYLRLLGGNQAEDSWENRGHFFSAAAEAMRRILVDHARRKKSLKRGGNSKKVSLDLLQLPNESDRLGSPEYVLSLNESLEELKCHDPTAAELVHLRYFSGLTIDQSATVLGISPRTAARTWNFARAWLAEKIFGISENS